MKAPIDNSSTPIDKRTTHLSNSTTYPSGVRISSFSVRMPSGKWFIACIRGWRDPRLEDVTTHSQKNRPRPPDKTIRLVTSPSPADTVAGLPALLGRGVNVRHRDHARAVQLLLNPQM